MNYNISVTNFKNQGSELLINSISIYFEKKIKMYRQFNNGIIVMIAEDDESAKDFSNSVYCYNYDGKLLWQMQKPSEVGKCNGHLVDMKFDTENDSQLIVFEFMGNRYIVNINDGKIVASYVSSW